MTDPTREPILDSDLVALEHGELDAQAARTAASCKPCTAWAAASTSSGRRRLPPSSTP